MRRQHGFTLIEMLLVVSIIVLLIAMLLPALGDARRAARSAVCLTNLGQLGRASVLYTTDHQGYFWPGMLNGSGSVFMWAGTQGTGGYAANGADDRWLNSYMGMFKQTDSVPLTQCPGDSWLFPSTGNSYGANNSHATSIFYPKFNLVHGHGSRPLHRRAIQHPKQWVLAGDHGINVWAWNETWQFYDTYYFHSRVGDERFNAAFGDASARTVHVPVAALKTDDYNYDYR
ncbi:MAG: type II secretion system protein [Phycisphaeraceae bacterium]